MNPPAPIDIARQRRRLLVMAVVTGLSGLVAVFAAIGFISRHQAWMGGLFVVALLVGFASQIWLVLGLKSRP